MQFCFTGAEADFYSQFNHSWLSSWAMAVDLTALKIYWAYALTGMHDLAMRQIIDGADALVSITSGPTKIEVSHREWTANQMRCLFGTRDANVWIMGQQLSHPSVIVTCDEAKVLQHGLNARVVDACPIWSSL